ncbi:MAG: Fumble domain-containing protein [Chloroflexi bacterium]|nr:MAG: Fumble domain-containing protein [Chloroflexota bacterium]RLC79636.1 MAG: Fumble domain-containing protein [Chloroflexota bacterium]
MGQTQLSAAIDFGISNTDAAARVAGGLHYWTRPTESQPAPHLVRAILADGGVELSALRRLAVTGGRHRLLPDRIGDCALVRVGEVEAIGRGGQALLEMSDQESATPILVMSAGSGTAVVEARGDQYTHITGSGVGGGTLIGLSRLLLHTTDHHEIDALAQRGDPNGADLSLADVVTGPIGQLPPDATAVNFGRLARHDIAVSREDLAAALVTLVGQTIALIAINAARARQVERIVATGHLIDMYSVRDALQQVGDIYGMRITLPPNAGYGTALGALLYGEG